MNITKYQYEPSLEAARAMKLGQEKHWYFKPMLPDYWNWDIKPLDFKINSTIPSAGLRRLEALKEAGVPISRIMYGHYEPKLLPPPRQEVERIKKEVKINIPWEELAEGFETLIKYGFEGLLIMGQVGLYLISMLAFVDPYIAVVLPDGTWIKVYEWVE